MSKSYKCDRCGKHYEGYTRYVGEWRTYSLAKVIFDEEDYLESIIGRSWDLCPKCMDAFVEWMDGEEE